MNSAGKRRGNVKRKIDAGESLVPAKLLIHPRPKGDESIGGYLLRLAHENRVADAGKIIKLLGLSVKAAMELGIDDIYRKAAGIVDPISPRLPRPIDPATTSFARSWRRTRICPACLSTYGYRRIAWDQHMAISCPEHNARLVEHCDQCGTPILYEYGGLYECRCGRDLRQIVPEVTPPWLSNLYAKFAPWRLHAVAQSGRVPCNVNDRQLVSMIRWVLNLARQAKPTRLRGAANRHAWFTPEEWRLVGQIFSDWPTTFRAIFGCAFGRMVPSYRRAAMKTIRTANLPEVLAVVEPIARTLDEMMGKKKLNRGPTLVPPSDDLVSLYEFRKAIGMDGKRARSLFDSGLLSRATVNVANGSRIKYWVGIEEVRAVKHWRATTLDLEEAARFMNCSSNHIRALVRAGYLASVDFSYFPSGRRFYASNLSKFMEGLRRRAVSPPAAVKNLVRLTELRLGYHESDKRQTWKLFMEALRTRQVALFHLGRPEDGYGDFAVRRSDVLPFIRVQQERGSTEQSIAADANVSD